MKVIGILQARTSSTRLPGKVLKKILDEPMILHQLRRLKTSMLLDDIIVATSIEKSDDVLAKVCSSAGYRVFRGSLDDVLDRFVKAIGQDECNHVVRLTADCPLTDAKIIDEIIEHHLNSDKDYTSNTLNPTYPDGLDAEIFKISALQTAWKNAILPSHREHVTPYIYKHPEIFSLDSYENVQDMSEMRWTVDEPEDLEVIKNVVNFFNGKSNFKWEEVIKLEREKPELFKSNKMYKRNEGALMGTGQKLWRRAKRVIPGGNMLLSKRPELYLPDKWPTYFSSAKGCEIWDLDGNHFFDVSNMSVGTNIIGYSNKEVNEAVIASINKGTMSSLNCPEEVLLAEKFVELHPWSQMVRFARSGGEANAIAIRIARAATGREVIAICGYHGWHDWYLATNLENSSGLEKHLLPGLDPKGVPKSLVGTVQPFSFNKYDQIDKIASNYELAAIKMEVQRSQPPDKIFLEKVRELCNRKNIVLIFDECTSGFRETNGGIHKKYGINPDMAMFGKSIGNGYPITAVIGKRNIMEAAQSTFISSTFWTDRVGPTAALKTLEIMEKENSWNYITNLGIELQKGWQSLAQKNQLKTEIGGFPALSNFKIISNNWLKYKTLITQELLKKGFLASNSCYISTSHNKKILNRYLEELDIVFQKISSAENEEIDINNLLEGKVCHSGFKRLN